MVAAAWLIAQLPQPALKDWPLLPPGTVAIGRCCGKAQAKFIVPVPHQPSLLLLHASQTTIDLAAT